MKPLVGIIMGSASDWETMRPATETLDKLAVPYEVKIVSAHRTPDLLFEDFRITESVASGQIKQGIVGDTAPEEQGQTCRKLMV